MRGFHQVLAVLIVLVPLAIPALADDGGQYLHWDYKIGGQERLRYEYRYNFNFNESRKDNATQFFNRLKLNAAADLEDEYLNKIARVFVEGLDARDWPYLTKAVSGQTDSFDLHQAFVDFYKLAGSDFDVKMGRQEMNYGAKRLIASPTWSNAVRSWDGAVIHYHHDGLYSDLLYGQNVQYRNEKFNISNGHELLSGIYSGWQKNAVSPLIEWYFLNQDDTRGTNDIHRETAGARIKLKLTPTTSLDVEVPYQWGRTGSAITGTKEIKAYAFHANIEKDLHSWAWSPRVNLSYDEASGNKSPHGNVSNTFVPLYQTVHEPYGEMDFFRWENMRNPELNVVFSPTKKLRFKPQIDFFWLQSKNDSWYDSSGTALRTMTSGHRSYYVGSETSLRFFYDFTKNLKFETGYAHFFCGGYVRDTGADDDADWVYSQLTFKF
ncbi:MAG: alginate export family protein [Candidatus Omnitrophica bacterium]|nr:alginate export family protein [Candidatus Omnitrophota bacterium]MDE2008649.1 alginate export family protein [Candidatus Omnitrophota bacterium]MDE2214968.1 alginate export family protein [Candidatus Omnitrophota bacterium]MDE2230907.1 alginate export family protein [Candidatus Omnitrophota bacterium]